MGIYKIKYSMNMAMNLMYSLAVAVALGAGGLAWPCLAASRSAPWWRSCPGLGKLNDPWGRSRELGPRNGRSTASNTGFFADGRETAKGLQTA